MALRTVILWIHVLSGVVWVGASASIALAGLALSGEPEEWRKFATRSAPRINRLCVVLACLIPLTGISNLALAVRTHRGVLPSAFVAVLSAKVALFAAMAVALWAAWRAGAPMEARTALSESAGTDVASVRKLMRLYGTIVVLGAMALALGLWLSGT